MCEGLHKIYFDVFVPDFRISGNTGGEFGENARCKETDTELIEKSYHLGQNKDDSWVFDSPYIPAFDDFDKIHYQMERNWFN